MSTTRVALTASHVLEAVQLAEKGTEKLRDWSDVREAGLRIRVRGYKAVWLFRFKNSTVTLGPANRWMPKQARELASHIRGMLRSDLIRDRGLTPGSLEPRMTKRLGWFSGGKEESGRNGRWKHSFSAT